MRGLTSKAGGKTLLEAAVAQALPYLDAESANEQVVKLLRQVGELERDLAAYVAAKRAGVRRIARLEAEIESLRAGNVSSQ